MARQITQAAQAAKLIRKHLKANGLKASVRSSSFANGSSITITLIDAMPATVKLVKEYVDRYEYGTFDAMTDCQGFKNRDFDGPQAKYVTVSTKWSDELLAEAKDYATTWWNDHRGWYEDDYRYSLDYFHNSILSGDEGHFWVARKPRQRAA